ncbi:hypothetical protein PPACK8108_LOCUS877 [Phakopsora pachyrhizi]|uniref:Uncharacterized protein n=1 Tax=Phakopsora pachyrhizi TaxID=170000 RepID=A0AAV0AH84_PHAPC|nr:hypothetical protein PPACK8108_LOCUS877 [Phakopsora pachyrhizi]
MTVLAGEQVRKPTNKKQEVDGLVVSQEARTDRLDYDLSRWEPEEYEYLKKKKIAELLVDYDSTQQSLMTNRLMRRVPAGV